MQNTDILTTKNPRKLSAAFNCCLFGLNRTGFSVYTANTPYRYFRGSRSQLRPVLRIRFALQLAPQDVDLLRRERARLFFALRQHPVRQAPVAVHQLLVPRQTDRHGRRRGVDFQRFFRLLRHCRNLQNTRWSRESRRRGPA